MIPRPLFPWTTATFFSCPFLRIRNNVVRSWLFGASIVLKEDILVFYNV